MVSDPRVTAHLHRLGGLYRDPNRIDRDASFLLKSSVGQHLQPGIAELVENNGQTCQCLVLQGTIAICFRGVTYQLLVDMFIPPGYPTRPPVNYVRLANANMFLKENHPHVGRDGMVYLPYLSEWKPHTHNLLELVVAMSSVFSADPPVFTRATPPPSSSSATATATVAMAQPPTVMAQPLTTATATRVQQVPTTGSSMTMNNRFNLLSYVSPPPPSAKTSTITTTSDADAASAARIAEELLAKEAEEANRAAEIARALEQQEQEQERMKQLQRQYEQQQFVKIKTQVTQKIYQRLSQQVTTSSTKTLPDYWNDQHVLPQNQRVLQGQLRELETRKQELEQLVQAVATQTKQLEHWLQDTKENHQQNTTTPATANTAAVSMDDLVVGSTKVQEQIIRLEAENNALSDLLYCLDRRMFNTHDSNNNSTDCATSFLKQVRQLAKRQFLVRAHLLKIKSTIPSCASF